MCAGHASVHEAPHPIEPRCGHRHQEAANPRRAAAGIRRRRLGTRRTARARERPLPRRGRHRDHRRHRNRLPPGVGAFMARGPRNGRGLQRHDRTNDAPRPMAVVRARAPANLRSGRSAQAEHDRRPISTRLGGELVWTPTADGQAPNERRRTYVLGHLVRRHAAPTKPVTRRADSDNARYLRLLCGFPFTTR